MKKYNLDKHNRQSNRLRNYDYSTPGYYFVTICTYKRSHLFGKISKQEMLLNEKGRIVKNEWRKTPRIRPYVQLDEFIIMPNHIHGIIIISGTGRDVLQYVPAKTEFKSPSYNLGTIIRGFKGAVTSRINKNNHSKGEKVWQPNYHERVIRNDWELYAVRRYIRENPQKWEYDNFKNAIR